MNHILLSSIILCFMIVCVFLKWQCIYLGAIFYNKYHKQCSYSWNSVSREGEWERKDVHYTQTLYNGTSRLQLIINH